MSKTKVVVRKLPPALTEEGFRQTAGKLLEDLPHTFFSFFAGKISHKRVVFSRAYINFESIESVLLFKSAFDGHLFVGTKGNSYRCSVEYAPYQKVPMSHNKKDGRDGTILKDPEYLEFVQALENGAEVMPSATAQLEAQERASASAPSGSVIVTPLMEYLQERYASNPGMKLGALRGRKKKDEEKIVLRKKQDDKKTALEGVNRPSRDKDSTEITAAAAAVRGALAGGKGSKQSRSKNEDRAATAPMVLLRPNSGGIKDQHGPGSKEHHLATVSGGSKEQQQRQFKGGAIKGVEHPSSSKNDQGARPHQEERKQSGRQSHVRPLASGGRQGPSSRPEGGQQEEDYPQDHGQRRQPQGSRQVQKQGQQQQQQQQHGNNRQVGSVARTAAETAVHVLQRLPTSGVTNAAPVAAAPAASQPPTAAVIDGSSQRSKKVRSGFQAYVPGSGRRPEGGQSGGRPDSARQENRERG